MQQVIQRLTGFIQQLQQCFILLHQLQQALFNLQQPLLAEEQVRTLAIEALTLLLDLLQQLAALAIEGFQPLQPALGLPLGDAIRAGDGHRNGSVGGIARHQLLMLVNIKGQGGAVLILMQVNLHATATVEPAQQLAATEFGITGGALWLLGIQLAGHEKQQTELGLMTIQLGSLEVDVPGRGVTLDQSIGARLQLAAELMSHLFVEELQIVAQTLLGEAQPFLGKGLTAGIV